MRVHTILPAAILLLTVPAFALKTVHTAHGAHARAQHASVRTATRAGSHRSLHAAVATPAHHEPAVSMPAERATAIQTALIQKGYLSGEPSGNWDAQTAAAMAKLQSDNGWQAHVTPDARALIKLGLGPSPEVAPPQ